VESSGAANYRPKGVYDVGRSLFRKATVLAGSLAAMAMAMTAPVVPLAAQSGGMMSEGYEFLKAVRERNGTKVTEALTQPGNTLIGTRDLNTGETALHIVVERRDATWVRFLLSNGANPNIEDKKGRTPLTVATDLAFVEGAEALLKAGARVDEPNAAGETPLISAVHRRDIGLVRLLLSSGANPRRSDNSGRSALDYAGLMNSSALLDEFARAEAAAKGAAKTYGPGL
jgi:uncharacterized protein